MMPTAELQRYCTDSYRTTFEEIKADLENVYLLGGRNRIISNSKAVEFEREAQREAIKITLIRGLERFPEEAVDIWRVVYGAHVARRSRVDNSDIIKAVISADQSWKKASGHAFEQAIPIIADRVLNEYGIDVILQRDLSIILGRNELTNHSDDINWLHSQTESSVFDLFVIVNRPGVRRCFGCIQSKTSIRDRVTRDREPSILAMRNNFWSIAITLNGDFFKNQMFIDMVNGGTQQHELNGWHGMYVFSEFEERDRIYQTDFSFEKFKQHALEAAEEFLNERQRIRPNWRASY